jgi:thiazole synthase ThiGH ThiG subunit
MAATNRMTEAQQMAQTLGVVVGAASHCEQVTEERVNAVSTKLRQLVSAAADDAADANAANEQFSVALEAGKTAVEMGRIDPEHAEAALTEIEQQL